MSKAKKDEILVPFEPYNLTPETAHTAILLLHSKETEIICQSLRALTKFCASGHISKRQLIFDLDAIKLALPHIDNNEINIKRYALKLVAQMCQLPRGPEQILNNPMNIKKIAQLLTTSQDLFVLEFASMVLAECSRQSEGCRQVLAANIIGTLLNKLRDCIDPDVQKNCLQVVQNLLNDPVAEQEITRTPQFTWPPLLGLMQSQYPAIQQGTLNVIKHLVGRYNDVNVQKGFKASSGVSDLCDILESYEFRDMHHLVMQVLQTFVWTMENSAHLYQTGCVQRLLDYLHLALPVMKSHVLSVFARMSTSASGRQALFDTGTDLVFCQHLLSSAYEVLADAAFGVGNMCKMWASAVRMADTNIVAAIANILIDESAAWYDTRMNSLNALTVLCSVHKAACATVEHKNWEALRTICRKTTENPPPIEAQRLTIQCYMNLLKYQCSKQAMLNGDFISEMIGCLQGIDMQLKILSAKLLTELMSDEAAKYFLLEKKGILVIDQNLRINHVGLRTILCELIIASITEESAEEFLELNTLHYMITNKTSQYKVCKWETALQAILSHNPSAKLAYTGRLELNDTTSEGFYVMKRMDDSFKTITDLLEAPGPFTDPVFLVNFLPSTGMETVSDIRIPYSRSSILSKRLSTRLLLPDDENLRGYLLQLRIWFGDPNKSLQYFEIADAHYEVRYREKCKEVSASLRNCAQVLGEYVAEQMSGLTQEGDCSMPSVEIHLADLMLQFQHRVIGLGFVKCGGALERAVLYKVLADRLGLPCSLHRTTNAHAWVEVAVPEIDPEEGVSDERYPAGLLRENYIVDLMVKPGKLVPLSSHEAKRICGPPSCPRYVARTPSIVCKCPRDSSSDVSVVVLNKNSKI